MIYLPDEKLFQHFSVRLGHNVQESLLDSQGKITMTDINA